MTAEKTASCICKIKVDTIKNVSFGGVYFFV